MPDETADQPLGVMPDVPVDCPVGTVLVDPKTGRWAVRFTRGDNTGKGQHVWLSPAGVVHAQARFLHHADVRGWEVAEARRWGRVADDEPLVDGDLRARCISALDELVSEYISPNEWGGYDTDYGQLADVVLAVVQPELERQAVEIRELRASREVWAIEAMGLDAVADRVLGWYSRVHDAISKAAKLPPSGTGVDDLVDAVARLARDLEKSRTNAGEWAAANEQLGLRGEALSGMLRGMARRATDRARAYSRLAVSSRVRSRAYLTVTNAIEGVQPYERSEVTAERIRKMRAELDELRSRPAVPADAEARLRRVIAENECAECGVDPVVAALLNEIRYWSAPVSGSDTTPFESPLGQATGLCATPKAGSDTAEDGAGR